MPYNNVVNNISELNWLKLRSTHHYILLGVKLNKTKCDSKLLAMQILPNATWASGSISRPVEVSILALVSESRVLVSV